MTETEMSTYIEKNKIHINDAIIVEAYNLNLIDTYNMYIETRMWVLKYHIQNHTSPNQTKHQREEMKKEKEFLLKEFGISQATFYRYFSNGVIKITNPILFRIMIITGRKSLTKELQIGTDDTYKSITNYVNTHICEDDSKTNYPIKYSYYFENKLSTEYCYKLWHKIMEPCYISDTTYNFKLTIVRTTKQDDNLHIHIIMENNNTKNADTKITNTTWKVKYDNYLSALGKRVDSWVNLNSDEDNHYIFIVQNLSGNKKITRYLELITLVKQKIMLHY